MFYTSIFSLQSLYYFYISLIPIISEIYFGHSYILFPTFFLLHNNLKKQIKVINYALDKNSIDPVEHLLIWCYYLIFYFIGFFHSKIHVLSLTISNSVISYYHLQNSKYNCFIDYLNYNFLSFFVISFFHYYLITMNRLFLLNYYISSLIIYPVWNYLPLNYVQTQFNFFYPIEMILLHICQYFKLC